MKEKTITLPREWFDGLVVIRKKMNNVSGVEKNDYVNFLLGYISATLEFLGVDSGDE